MTKKSANRLMRDEAQKDQDNYFKENKVFDELKDIHLKIGSQLQAFCTISALAKDANLCSYLNNQDDVIEKIRLMSVDLEKIIKDLNMNFEEHKDLSGGATNPDDHMKALQIFQNYLQITSVVEGVIMPTSTSILEQFSIAEQKRNQLNSDKSIEVVEENATDTQKTANTI